MKQTKHERAAATASLHAAAYPQALALYVGGQWRDAQGRETLAVRNPANGAELGRLPVATDEDIDLSLIHILLFHVTSPNCCQNGTPSRRAKRGTTKLPDRTDW